MEDYPLLYCLESNSSKSISFRWYIGNNNLFGEPEPKNKDNMFTDSDGITKTIIGKFQPYSVFQSKNKEATARVYVNNFPSMGISGSSAISDVYTQAKHNEEVTIIDINPNHSTFQGSLGWCKIRNNKGEEKFYPICHLQFDDNF